MRTNEASADGSCPDWEPPTAQERALAAALRARELEELREPDGSWTPEGWAMVLECGGPGETGGSGAAVGTSESATAAVDGPWRSDEQVIADVLEHGVGPWSWVDLAGIDPQTLPDPLERVRFVQAVDAVAAHVAAAQSRALAVVAGRRSSGDSVRERHVEHEVAFARRTSRGAAGRSIEVARALVREFTATTALLERGRISEGHALALVTGTANVISAARRRAVQDRVLPEAASLSVGQFRRRVAAAVCEIDANAESARHQKARARRRDWISRRDDGLGQLILLDDWTTVSAIHQRLTREARLLQRERGRAVAPGSRRRHRDRNAGSDAGAGDRSLGACRADRLSALVLGEQELVPGRGGRTIGEPRRPRIEGRLVIDLATLRGEADYPAHLDGTPIPARVGRRMAREISHWRRMVTDPVTGHLLDYGRRTYLPAALRDFVGERDQTCRNPWCDHPAGDAQLDHATPFPPRTLRRRQYRDAVLRLPRPQDGVVGLRHRHRSRRLADLDHAVGPDDHCACAPLPGLRRSTRTNRPTRTTQQCASAAPARGATVLGVSEMRGVTPGNGNSAARS